MKKVRNGLLKNLHYISLAGIIALGLMTIIATGGGGDGSETSVSTPEGDFEETIIQEGAMGETGRYSIETFSNAAPAQKQLNQNNIPNVFEEHGNLYVMDIQDWPDDWDIGKVIAVRMVNGHIEYKRLLAKFELADGSFAIGVEEASVLEVFKQAEMNSSGNVDGVLSSSYQMALAKIIDFPPIDETRQITLINKTDLEVFNKCGVYLGFSEINLEMNPTIGLILSIDKPSGITQLFGKIDELNQSTLAVLQGEIDQIDDVFINNMQVIVGALLIQAEEITDTLLSDPTVSDYIGAIRAVLVDRTRLKKVDFSLEGDITGTVRVEARASGSYSISLKEVSLPIPSVLVPIGGPVPILLEFEPVAERKFRFDGEAAVHAGMTVIVPVNIRAVVTDGVLQTIEKNDISPVFIFPDEYNFIEKAKADFLSSLGVQVEIGLTLVKLLTVSIDPTASAVFEASASVEGNDTQWCADINWDLYARLHAEAEAELLSMWDIISWPIPFDFPFYKGQEPMGSYSYCWPESGTSSGLIDNEDGTITQIRNDSSRLMWLKDANYAQTSGYDADGRMTWDEALAWIASLNSSNHLGYNDWRLPAALPVNATSYDLDWSCDGSTDVGYNITSPNSEMSYMYYVELENLGYHAPDPPDCTFPQQGWGLSNTSYFCNLMNAGHTPGDPREDAAAYWTGTTHPDLINSAFDFRFKYGDQSAHKKTYDNYVWAVRDVE
jgi:hypothetical protein